LRIGDRKILLRLLGLGIAGSLVATPLFAQGVRTAGPGKSAQAPEKKYVYAARESADIHFFPVESARWNGYELRAREWPELTDFLKKRFLRDAKAEIEARENAVILVNDMDRLLKAMDESLRELQTDPKLKETPVMKFFYLMLEQNNAIKKAWTLVKAPKGKKK